MIHYYNKHALNLLTASELLCKLLCKDATWIWELKQEEILQKQKEQKLLIGDGVLSDVGEGLLINFKLALSQDQSKASVLLF